MISRRDLVAVLGALALAPRVVAAQSADLPLVGVMINFSEKDARGQAYRTLLEDALRNAGRGGVRLEFRYGTNYASNADDLLRLKPDVLLVTTTGSLRAAAARTSTVPIIFTTVSDPVAQGFVKSLAHPGGNITGFANFEVGMGGKWVDLLADLQPGLGRVLFLHNPETSPQSPLFLRSIEAAASKRGLATIDGTVRREDEIAPAIEGFAREPKSGMIVASDTFLEEHAVIVLGAVAKYHVPAVYGVIDFAVAGGLVTYAPDMTNNYLGAAGYVDRILKGAKPGDLPVQEPTKFTLIINLQAAKAFGFEVPTPLLMRADRVIE